MARVHYKYPAYPADTLAEPMFARYEVSCALRNKLVQNKDEVRDSCYKAARWLTDTETRPWLFILGSVGTGKSTLLSSISYIQSRLVQSLKTTRMLGGLTISALDLPKLSSDEDSEYQYWRTLTGEDRAEYLYLDDIGQEPTEVKSYGNGITPFAEIVAKRYNSQLPLIVTSNLSTADFKRKYGERVSDRIREMAEVIIIKTESYR